MNNILPYLLSIHVMLIVGMAVISWFIFVSFKTHLQKLILIFWCMNILNVFLNALATLIGSDFGMILGTVMWPVLILHMHKFMIELSPQQRTIPKSYYLIIVSGYMASIGMCFSERLAFHWKATPVIGSLAYVGLCICGRAYKSFNPKKQDVLKNLTLICMTSFMIHMMDWPFVVKSEFAPLGYTYFLFNLICFAVVLPAVSLKMAMEKEKAVLERLVEDRTQLLLNQSKFSALGEMASGMAHEINNPLAVIHASSEKLLRSVQDETVKTEMKRILNMTDRISKIVRALLDFSSRNQKEQPTDVDLDKCIEETISFCHEKFENHKIQFLVSGDTKLKIRTRSHHLSQVLLNLLNNAFDAVSNQETKWIHLNVSQTSKSLLIEVVDSGPGIPDHIREKIMQPFFTTKEVGKGTGIGLSISKGLIEDNKGSLFLDSSKPNTTFVIDFPLS